MPKYRQLHVKIIESFDFNEMPNDFTRVLWLLLTLVLDSEGRGIDNASWLRSRLFPLRTDVEINQIAEAFDWLEKRQMIIRYQVNGRGYFYIPTFKQYQSGTQKEADSVLPPPPAKTPEQLPTYSGVNPEEVGAAASASASESALYLERPNIFAVYEQEIGPLTAGIGEALKQAEIDYPSGWAEDALKEAAKYNKRSWAYAETILKRWMAEGKGSKSNGQVRKPAPQYTGQIILADGQVSEVRQ